MVELHQCHLQDLKGRTAVADGMFFAFCDLARQLIKIRYWQCDKLC